MSMNSSITFGIVYMSVWGCGGSGIRPRIIHDPSEIQGKREGGQGSVKATMIFLSFIPSRHQKLQGSARADNNSLCTWYTFLTPSSSVLMTESVQLSSSVHSVRCRSASFSGVYQTTATQLHLHLLDVFALYPLTLWNLVFESPHRLFLQNDNYGHAAHRSDQ